jgi:hypothetical protein
VLYRLLADVTVLLHLSFVVFVMLGGLLVLWKPLLAWCHVPAVFWGAAIEFLGWVCPLTYLENMLRSKGSGPAYETGFVDNYIVPLLYPADLTRTMHIGLGLIVLVVNSGVYWTLWHKSRKRNKTRLK